MQTIHRPGNWGRPSWFLRFVRSREGNEEAVRSLRHETPEMRENCCIEGFELLWMYYYDILLIWLWCNDNSDSKAFAVWQTFAATVQIGTMEWEDWRSSIFLSSFGTFFPKGMRTATWEPRRFPGWFKAAWRRSTKETLSIAYLYRDIQIWNKACFRATSGGFCLCLPILQSLASRFEDEAARGCGRHADWWVIRASCLLRGWPCTNQHMTECSNYSNSIRERQASTAQARTSNKLDRKLLLLCPRHLPGRRINCASRVVRPPQPRTFEAACLANTQKLEMTRWPWQSSNQETCYCEVLWSSYIDSFIKSLESWKVVEAPFRSWSNSGHDSKTGHFCFLSL